MVKKYVHILIGLFLVISFNTQLAIAQDELIEQDNQSAINWGVKIGMNGTHTNYLDAYLNDSIHLEDAKYTNKIGYSSTGFVRINLDNFFFQPELTWNMYKQNLSFSFPTEDTEGLIYNKQTELALKTSSLGLSILAGYNIVKNGPFLINMFGGASFKCLYRQDFKLNQKNTITNSKFNYDYSGILGFSLTIDKIYFDMKYEFVMPNTPIKLGSIEGFPPEMSNISIDKNENIMSFSLGIMF